MINLNKSDEGDLFDDDALSLTQRQARAKDIVHRMKQAMSVKSAKALAEKLQLNPRAVSNWLQKGAVPWYMVYACHKHTGKSLDWLYYGHVATINIGEQSSKAIQQDIQQLLSYAQRMKMIEILKENDLGQLTQSFIDTLQKNLQ